MGRKPIKDKFSHIKGKQRRWQCRMSDKGLCSICGNEPAVLYERGEKCLRKFLEGRK